MMARAEGALAPAVPTLGAGQVHVWRIEAGAATTALRPLLIAAEAARADRFRADRDRDRFVQFRAALRQVLGRHLGLAPVRVPLAEGPHGKPCLAPEAGLPDLQFNLAHSGDLALLALCAAAPVGIDLEQARPFPRADRLAARVFSATERAAYADLPPAAREAAFLRGWTRKEAYLKATGDGLTVPLDHVSVTLAPEAPPLLLEVEGRPGAPATWRLHDLGHMLPGAFGALATPLPDADLRWFVHDFNGVADPAKAPTCRS